MFYMNKRHNEKTVYIVIPAYNEATVIFDVIGEIKKSGFHNIIVVTKTGIEAARLSKADIIVTMDGDGQHDPKDISSIIAPIVNNHCDVVLGTRLKNPQGMPMYKIIQNYIGNILTWYLFGLWVTDSQSGFRAYTSRAADLINTKYDRYEYDSEVIREIYLYKLKYKEVPIAVRYTQYSMTKDHKQDFANGIKTVYKMLLKLLS